MNNQEYVSNDIARSAGSAASHVDIDEISPRKIQNLLCECSTDDESASMAPSSASFDDRDPIDGCAWKDVGKRLAAGLVSDVIVEEEDFDIHALMDVNSRFASVFASMVDEEDECEIVCSGA